MLAIHKLNVSIIPSMNFRNITICNKKRANIKDLRVHDLRHEATSRLFELGLDAMEVSTITGHKTLSMLKRYTHLKARNLAQKLAAL